MGPALLLLTGLLGAAAPPPAPPDTTVSTVVVTARKPTKVADVVVTATVWCPEPNPARYPADHAPRVVDSFPAQGGVVAPGITLVRVTFDAPMSCYSEVTVIGDAGDPCEPAGAWALPARRSWVMQCRLAPGAAYTLRFRKSDGAGFVGLSGREALPYDLAFTTSTAQPTPTAEAAQRADPGPPGEPSRTAAYVTCVDARGAVRGADCTHQVFKRPE